MFLLVLVCWKCERYMFIRVVGVKWWVVFFSVLCVMFLVGFLLGLRWLVGLFSCRFLGVCFLISR